MSSQGIINIEQRSLKHRSDFSHYLPRLKREFYQGDAVVFWTMPIANRQENWLTEHFHSTFREMTLHAASREGILCPAYCLMPDHIHFVWMGLRHDCDQRNGVKFFRAQTGPFIKPAKFQHQAHDHVLSAKDRQRQAFAIACADYTLLNPLKAGLVSKPEDWPYSGAVVPGYPRINPFTPDYWPWFWKHYFSVHEPDIEKRALPRHEME
jgi:REP element-mobilizing transposase RayT